MPGDSEFVCVRMARRKPHHSNALFIVLDGEVWVVATPGDLIEPAPRAPKIKKS